MVTDVIRQQCDVSRLASQQINKYRRYVCIRSENANCVHSINRTVIQLHAKTWAESVQEQRLLFLLTLGGSHFARSSLP